MVSTTTFVSVDNVSAPLFAASAAKCAVPSVAYKPSRAPSAFKLQDVSINGVAPSTLPELFALGNARHYPNEPDAPPTADHAFSGHSEFTNDVAYFKALLQTRMRMRMALETNLQSLRELRAKNNALIRKRKASRKNRRADKAKAAATATAAATQLRAVALQSASIITDDTSIATTTPTPPPTNPSGGTVDDGIAVADNWHACSSPVSTEDDLDDMAKDHGKGHGQGCRIGEQAVQNVQAQEAAMYRV